MRRTYKLLIVITIITIVVIATLLTKNRVIALSVINEENTFYTEDSLTKKQQAVIAVAKAFYYRETAIQYDDASMNYQTNNSRKRRSSYTHRPEDATIQDIKYSVCAEFVNNVYYEAFEDGDGNPYEIKGGDGSVAWFTELQVELANSNSKYYNSNIAVDYIENPAESLEENKERIASELLPGDLIVYRVTNGSGHVLLYLGDDLIINASSISNEFVGGTYDYKEKRDCYEEKGTIGFVSLNKDVLNYQNRFSKYILSTSVTKVAILRPLNEISENPTQKSDYRISEDTIIRMQYPELVRMKTASLEKYENINLGDEITYTITLENKSATEDYDNIIITDKVPLNTEFVELTGNGTNQNGNLNWVVSVPHGEKIVISYTVKIIEDKQILGTTIVNDSTEVSGIPLNKIEFTVNKTLTEKEKTKLLNKSYANIGNSFETTEKFINSIYTELNIPDIDELLSTYFTTQKVDIGVSGTNSAIIGQIGDKGEKDIYILKSTFNNENIFAKMYVKNLFGGIYTITENEPTLDDGRNKTYSNSTFTIGDILLVCDDDYKTDTYAAGEKNMYLYLGENTFATVLNEQAILIDKGNGEKLIDSLLGQNCFIVLRPSIILEKEIESEKYEISENTIKNITEKTTKQEFLENIENALDAKIYNKNNEEIQAGNIITTGMKLINNEHEYTLIVLGDTNGDGKITLTDLSQTILHILEKNLLIDEYKQAADINLDNEITLTDLSKMKLHLVGLELIK